MNKIQFIGAPGAGKSTLAQQVANIGGYKVVDLDQNFHLPNWQMRANEDFQERVSSEIEGEDKWILDGDYYSRLGNVVLDQIDTVVWVNTPLVISQGRLVRRSAKRIITRELLWGANRENIRGAYGLLKFARNKHRELKEQVQERWVQNDSVEVIELTSRAQAIDFIERCGQE